MTREQKDQKRMELESRLAHLRQQLEDALLAAETFYATRSHMPENPTELDFMRQQRQFKKLFKLMAAQDSAFLVYSDTLLELRPYDRQQQSVYD